MINANVIVNGSIDSASLAQVQQAIAGNNLRIMSSLPHAIDARVIESTRYRRFGGKR